VPWKDKLSIVVTEDRGDGRSHCHTLHVPVIGTARVRVQPDKPDLYVARLEGVGNVSNPSDGITCDGETPEEAVENLLWEWALSVQE